MAEGHSGRLRPGGAVRRGLWTLLLAPIMVVAIPGVAAADVDPNYPMTDRCKTTQSLHVTPSLIDENDLPTTVTVTGSGFPSEATVDPALVTPTPTFEITISRDGTNVATARGERFTVAVTIPKGAPDVVTITAVSDEWDYCRASAVVRFETLPVTGSDTTGLLWFGITALTLGAAMAVGARRRTHAPERHRMALAGAMTGPGLLPAPAPRTDAVVSAFAPQPSSAPVPAAVLDRFTVEEQLNLLAPSGPPQPPPATMGQAVEQLRSLFARLARDD